MPINENVHIVRIEFDEESYKRNIHPIQALLDDAQNGMNNVYTAATKTSYNALKQFSDSLANIDQLRQKISNLRQIGATEDNNDLINEANKLEGDSTNSNWGVESELGKLVNVALDILNNMPNETEQAPFTETDILSIFNKAKPEEKENTESPKFQELSFLDKLKNRLILGDVRQDLSYDFTKDSQKLAETRDNTWLNITDDFLKKFSKDSTSLDLPEELVQQLKNLTTVKEKPINNDDKEYTDSDDLELDEYERTIMDKLEQILKSESTILSRIDKLELSTTSGIADSAIDKLELNAVDKLSDADINEKDIILDSLNNIDFSNSDTILNALGKLTNKEEGHVNVKFEADPISLDVNITTTNASTGNKTTAKYSPEVISRLISNGSAE